MTRRLHALVTAAALLLAGCGDAPEPRPTAEPTPTERTPRFGEVRYGGTKVAGEWERGDLLGTPLELGDASRYAEILYAARGDAGVYVATGIRDGDRILRTIVALRPGDAPADGIDLYGGDVLGKRGPDDRVGDGRYLLLGSVPGDEDVQVAGPAGHPRPVTTASADVLPGFTVFYDAGAWQDDWDQVQLAPLMVSAGDGPPVAVRKRSWTG